MAGNKNDSSDVEQRLRSRDKRIGQFIFWIAASLITWSFVTTLMVDKEIPVIKQRLNTNEAEISILRGEYARHAAERNRHHTHRKR